jgi:hypothetical protein
VIQAGADSQSGACRSAERRLCGWLELTDAGGESPFGDGFQQPRAAAGDADSIVWFVTPDTLITTDADAAKAFGSSTCRGRR